MQAVFKTREGAAYPDRDAQFAFINTLTGKFCAPGEPVVSMDTKKKELVGVYTNDGQE